MNSDSTNKFTQPIDKFAEDLAAERGSPSMTPDAAAPSTAPKTLLDRLREYEREALGKDNTLQSCLGATTAGLMKIGRALQRELLRAIATSEGDFVGNAKLQTALDAHLRVMRQIERLAFMELRCVEIQHRTRELERQLEEAASGRSTPSPARPRKRFSPRW